MGKMFEIHEQFLRSNTWKETVKIKRSSFKKPLKFSAGTEHSLLRIAIMFYLSASCRKIVQRVKAEPNYMLEQCTLMRVEAVYNSVKGR